MHAQIALLIKNILLSSAFQTEVDKYTLDFTKGATINIVDANGVTVPITLQHPVQIDPLQEAFCEEPPRNVPGPFPRAYVYHIQSEYPAREQEELIRVGYHRIGVSFYVDGQTPEDAEINTQVLGSACIQCLERNAHLFSSLPRAEGGSSLAAGENEVSGQKLPQLVSPFHLIMVIKLRERRNF